MTRHAILSKPHWQSDAASPVLLSMPLEELRALDSLLEFVIEHECVELDVSDCRTWARISGGEHALRNAIAAIHKTDGADAPALANLSAAEAVLAACTAFGGIARQTTRVYERKISLAQSDLPRAWQEQLTRIRGRMFDGKVRKTPDLFDRMTRKLCQLGWFLHDSEMPLVIDIPALQAFYTYETTRISQRGKPLAPATITATFSDLRDFLTMSQAYPAELPAEIDKLLVKLRERADTVLSQKFAALAKLDATRILPRAEEIASEVRTHANPAKRIIQRNRALALALPPMTPLRREWHELRFGRDIVWSDGRYRFRDYKLRKTRHLAGRETYPGSVHPSVQRFVDARLLQDDDPKYLDTFRATAEADQWALFQHPDGGEVSANYVSQVWSSEFETGANICRTIVYDIVFAISENATLAGTVLNDHTSKQARESYTSKQAKAAALSAASKEVEDIFDAFDL
ncbi:hypothetical protein E4Z66_19205 [Aliishimia ponticola]|uniref:Uncharacterized protein n=1 Tax=Aliishimia ponticola TaxID=2499833 RepID=A0A4S4N7N7_9RHOB|nr:hypothetical protein [Aliishimia ponticola]THH34327.1 hypothetical protein E4Z66_19205 [Aliishimia ponticola]